MKIRNKIFTIVLVALLVVAVLSMIIAYAIIGFDIIKWFSSQWALWIYAGVGCFLFVWLTLELIDRNKRL